MRPLGDYAQLFKTLCIDNVERVGAPGHVCTDEQYETLRSSGALPDDPVGEAEDIILLERIKKLLLQG